MCFKVLPRGSEEAGQKERGIRGSEDGASASAGADGEDAGGTGAVFRGAAVVTQWCTRQESRHPGIRSAFLGSEAEETDTFTQDEEIRSENMFLRFSAWQC